MRRSHLVAAAMGPALIVAAVLVLLHGYAFSGKMANGDIPTFWLPTYCFLGKNLASGHIPAWNPYAMAGVPFAADPQSGWLYFPAMLLFSVLPCHVAIRIMVVIQPILAGLGIYWFLRTEGAQRSSSTVGGLVLALGIAGSQLTNSIPFASTLAWTALSLAAVSRYLRASGSHGRLVWAGLFALTCGQLAAAHFSVGMLIGAGVLGVYLVSKLWDDELLGLVGGRKRFAVLAGALPLVIVVINLGFLLPRLAYLPRTSVGLGYKHLDRLATELSGYTVSQPVPATAPTWPLKLATTPGAHVGGLALALLFVPFTYRRFRPFALGLALLGALFYVLSLRAVARWVGGLDTSMRPVDSYLHSPEWWGYGLLPIFAILAGLGAELWISEPATRARIFALAAAALVWGALPVAFGADPFELSFLLLGAATGGVVLAASRGRAAFMVMAPAVLVVELVLSGLQGYRPPPFQPIPRLLADRAEPTIDAADYVRPGPVDRTLRVAPTGRYLTQNFGGWERLQADPRSTLFGIEQVQGYNPVQLLRYWMFVRTVSRRPLLYNLSLIDNPSQDALDLLNVRYVAASSRPSTVIPARLLLRSVPLSLYELRDTSGRASLLHKWRVVPHSREALETVTAPSFDPSRIAILERSPGIEPQLAASSRSEEGARGRDVEYSRIGPQEALVRVISPSPALVLIRIPYDPNWHATVDGRKAPLLVADFLVQAVPVPKGRHTVLLSYDDPSVGYGLLGSALSLLAIGVAALVLSGRPSARISGIGQWLGRRRAKTPPGKIAPS